MDSPDVTLGDAVVVEVLQTGLTEDVTTSAHAITRRALLGLETDSAVEGTSVKYSLLGTGIVVKQSRFERGWQVKASEFQGKGLLSLLLQKVNVGKEDLTATVLVPQSLAFTLQLFQFVGGQPLWRGRERNFWRLVGRISIRKAELQVKRREMFDEV